MVTSFERQLIPRSVEKIAHFLGRKKMGHGTTKRLVSPEELTKKTPKLLSSLLKVTVKNSRLLKNVQKIREYGYGGKTDQVTCHSCGRFTYNLVTPNVITRYDKQVGMSSLLNSKWFFC